MQAVSQEEAGNVNPQVQVQDMAANQAATPAHYWMKL